VHLMKSGNI